MGARWPRASRPLRLLVLVAALAPAALLRLHDLAVRPFHHDEGVNGWFFVRLWAQGDYRYDPGNYHGPTLYFLSLPFAWMAGGPSDAVLRGVAVAASLATVALATALAPRLGRSGAGAAALLLAVSPAAVYFGRDYIHESLFALCTLGLVVAGERAATTGARTAYVAAGVAAGVFVATKETAFPHLAIFGAALLAAAPRAPLVLVRKWGGPALAAAAALVVAAGFYTNGFTAPSAILDPIRALPGWISRGTGGVEHAKPWFTYLAWLSRMEAGLLVLGVLGVVVGLVTRRPFDRFVAVWAAGTLVFYSALSYKTPWLVVGLVLPLAVAAGLVVREAWRIAAAHGGVWPRAGVAAVLVLVVGLGAGQAWDAAIVRYDDSAVLYPYAQTVRGYRDLLAAVDAATAGRDPGQVRLAVTAKEYWPLPWDLRRFPQAAWFGAPREGLDHDVVIAAADAPPPVADPAAYDRTVFPLRGGIELALYVRRR